MGRICTVDTLSIVLADALTFLGIVLVTTVTPGPDMALMMRNVLAHGYRATVPTLTGIVAGLLVHATLCVAGLSVVLRESELAFSVVKLAGGAWLAWMGLTAIIGVVRSARAGRDGAEGAVPETPVETWNPRALRRGALLTNLLNVKVALLYVALLPQFAPSGDGFVPFALALAVVQITIGVAWHLLYALAVARTRDALAGSPRVRRWIEGATGAALIGFGVRLAGAAR